VLAGTVGLAITAPRSENGSGTTASALNMPHSPTARAVPRVLSIPSIGVQKRVVQLSAGKGHTMELPPTDGVGWYVGSPAPGEPGAAVVTGFIRVGGHRGAFARLGELATGARVSVVRSDGTTAVYRVERIDTYPPDRFPVSEVYGATSEPTLRIVTTGGRLRPGAPNGNAVVFATLSDLRAANSKESALVGKK